MINEIIDEVIKDMENRTQTIFSLEKETINGITFESKITKFYSDVNSETTYDYITVINNDKDKLELAHISNILYYNESLLIELDKIIKSHIIHDLKQKPNLSFLDLRRYTFFRKIDFSCNREIEELINKYDDLIFDQRKMIELIIQIETYFTNEYTEIILDEIIDKTIKKYPNYENIDIDFFRVFSKGYLSHAERACEPIFYKDFNNEKDFKNWVKIIYSLYDNKTDTQTLLTDYDVDEAIKNVDDIWNQVRSGCNSELHLRFNEIYLKNIKITNYLSNLTIGDIKAIFNNNVLKRYEESINIDDVLNRAKTIVEMNNYKKLSLTETTESIHNFAEKTTQYNNTQKEILEICMKILENHNNSMFSYMIKEFSTYINDSETIIKSEDIKYISKLINQDVTDFINLQHINNYDEINVDNTFSIIYAYMLVHNIEFKNSIVFLQELEQSSIKFNETELENYINNYEDYKNMPLSWVAEFLKDKRD